MGVKNYLIAGGSGTGKTTVAEELQRRGYNVLHGDRELCYRGDPDTGRPVEEPAHENERAKALWVSKHHVWNANKVKSIVADQSSPISFFCGSCRNFDHFIDLFDEVFILEVGNLDVLFRRIGERVARDPTDWGGRPEEMEIVVSMHANKEGVPAYGIIIDATAPLVDVVEAILSKCETE